MYKYYILFVINSGILKQILLIALHKYFIIPKRARRVHVIQPQSSHTQLLFSHKKDQTVISFLMSTISIMTWQGQYIKHKGLLILDFRVVLLSHQFDWC